MASPEASVVIRTFNEEKYLPGLLESLRSQTFRDYEIVLVDSGSVDRTRELAAPWADKLIRIESHDFTFGYSLNVGIGAAEGKYAVIVSAHTLPSSHTWLESLLRPLREEPTAMSYGRQLGWSSGSFSEAQDFGRIFGTRHRVLRPPHYFAHNGNSALRKELWSEHPFDVTLPGLEDIEWAKYWMDRGYQVVYEPEAALYHIHDESWPQVRRRYYREALAARWIGIKGRRHVIIDPAKELSYAFLDLGRALLGPGSNSSPERMTKARGSEVFLYRTNKAIGSVRGLLDGKTMRDPAAREAMFFDRRSRRVVIHGPGRASLEEISIPEIKPGEVLIRTAYTGVCGTDLDLFDGKVGYYQDGTAKYPIVPGHEVSGHVVATGPNVGHLKEGDRVVAEYIQNCGACDECRRNNWNACPNRAELGIMGRDGGYARYMVVPGRFVRTIPAGLDLATAALCQPLAVVLKGLNRLVRTWPPTPETKRCAVVGAGSLGHFCARVLALWGHNVTVFDRDPQRRGYFQGSDIKVSNDLERLAEFDALIEVTGDPEVLEPMLRQSPPGATILLLAFSYSRTPFALESIVARDKTVIGSGGCGSQEFEEALRLLPSLELDSYLQCILPLDQYRDAWEAFRQRKYLKVILAAEPEQS